MRWKWGVAFLVKYTSSESSVCLLQQMFLLLSEIKLHFHHKYHTQAERLKLAQKDRHWKKREHFFLANINIKYVFSLLMEYFTINTIKINWNNYNIQYNPKVNKKIKKGDFCMIPNFNWRKLVYYFVNQNFL